MKKLDLLLSNHNRAGNRAMNYSSRKTVRFFPRNKACSSKIRKPLRMIIEGLPMLLNCGLLFCFCPENISAAGKTTPSILTANSCHSEMVIYELHPDKINSPVCQIILAVKLIRNVLLQLSLDLRTDLDKRLFRPENLTQAINVCHILKK